MNSGIVFDIKEFAIYDGPGIRTTVFMKGCPLRCQWCHNPEGLSKQPQLLFSRAACRNCGSCRQVCENEKCTACGKCVSHCPLGLRRIAGTAWTAQALAGRLMKNKVAFDASNGGVTFSGGEPLLQWDFIEQVIAFLPEIHVAVETSGYADENLFLRMQNAVQLVMMDIKLVDNTKHKRYTGVENVRILQNLNLLKLGNTPYIIRIPLIPGVNDDAENLENTAALLENPGPLVRVELLPYHQTAGAKYEMIGMNYRPDFHTDLAPQIILEPFQNRNLPVMVL